MAMVRCERGHFFDREKAGRCPHCPDAEPSEPKARLVRDDDDARTQRIPRADDEPRTVRLRGGPEDVTVVPPPPGGRREAPGPAAAPPAAASASGASSGGVARPAPAGEPTSGDPTRRVWSGAFSTVLASESPAAPIDPVTGWLVCIAGAARGADFALRGEGNFVGRGDENDVVLAGDDEVSRFKHACVFFDPAQRAFVLHKGESTRKSLHLNGRPVYEPAPLRAGDRIRLGRTELLFVPLCGPDFDWGEIDSP